MSTEENKALARRFVLEHNQAEYQTSFDQLLSPDCSVHEYLPGMPESMNRATYEQFIGMFRAALPDIHNSVADVIAEGEKVVVRWIGIGTHTGASLMDIPAAGNQVTAHGMYIFRFRDNRIAEIWNNWDNLSVMQQLGTVPQPEPVQA